MSSSSPFTTRPGAAMDWAQNEFGGICQVKVTTVNVTASTLTQLAGANPDRIALTIANIGANDILINPGDTGGGVGTGIDIGALGGAVNMNVRDDMVLPSFLWQGIATAGNTTIFVIELIRQVATVPVQS